MACRTWSSGRRRLALSKRKSAIATAHLRSLEQQVRDNGDLGLDLFGFYSGCLDPFPDEGFDLGHIELGAAPSDAVGVAASKVSELPARGLGTSRHHCPCRSPLFESPHRHNAHSVRVS